MKKNRLQLLNGVDEKFLNQADDENLKKEKKHNFLKLIIIPTCLSCIIISICLYLFIPFAVTPPDVSRYKNSEYYSIIKSLNEFTFDKPLYKNNYYRIKSEGLSLIPSAFKNVTDDAMQIPEQATNESYSQNQNYKEVTDNQVDGVIEADKFKRTDKYIYYLHQKTLYVYGIDKQNTKLITTYNFNTVGTNDYQYYDGKKFDVSEPTYYYDETDMFLTKDCNTIYIITNLQKWYNNNTTIITLDVSDVNNITQKNVTTISGSIISSRLVENKLLVVTNYYINKHNINFDKLETFLPYIDQNGNKTYVKNEDIIFPNENLYSTNFTIITAIANEQQKNTEIKSFFSYSGNYYATAENIYLTRTLYQTDNSKVNNTTYQTQMAKSVITKVGYKDKLNLLGSVNLDGLIKDQYSLDEYDGILRVATTTRQSKVALRNYSEYYYDSFSISQNKVNANLYLIDANSMQIVNKTLNFAPNGEDVKSVRFDKNMAYICTSIMTLDPVFFFDLTNINDIKVSKTKEIEGFSTSLINFGNGYLLGIGVNKNNSFKVEVYKQIENLDQTSNENVVSVCYFEPTDSYCHYSSDYKAYYIDRQNQNLGITIDGYYKNSFSNYLLLNFDGEKINVLKTIDLQHVYNINDVRSVVIDDYLYVLNGKEIIVEQI